MRPAAVCNEELVFAYGPWVAVSPYMLLVARSTAGMYFSAWPERKLGSDVFQAPDIFYAVLAVNYLSDERLKSLEIAMLLGYSSISSFTTAFKSWYDMPPAEYRQKFLVA